MKLKGPQFSDVDDIQEDLADELKKVQKEEFSAGFYRKCTSRAKACVCANGAYF
jgi:hypothetical protein